MKILKIVIGVLSSLYTALQLVDLIVPILGPRRYEGGLEFTRYGAMIAAICIGLAIAVACFKPRRGRPKINDSERP